MIPQAQPQAPIYLGKKTKITLPSGKVVTIRESNGDDDDILSDTALADDGGNIVAYLANIIEHDSELDRKPLSADVWEYLSSDKWYLLFKQRLINLDKIFKVENHECQNDRCEHVFDVEEDLSIFDGDLSDPTYQPGNPQQVGRYPYGNKKVVEFTLSSGKQFRIKVLDSILEKKSLAGTEAANKRNYILFVKELEVLTSDNKWERVLSLAPYSQKEANALRAWSKKVEVDFSPIIKINCPKCGAPNHISLLLAQGFYYPEETTI